MGHMYKNLIESDLKPAESATQFALSEVYAD